MAEEIETVFSPGEKIVSMIEFRGKIFVATASGVWEKEPHSNVFRPMRFEKLEDKQHG